jgi:V8-like Glu-specific endopeptidase
MKQIKFLPLLLILFSDLIFAQHLYNGINLDTVKAQRFDTGKMWTFDFPPGNYFDSAYNFKLSKDWLDEVRLSSLRFGFGCSASFISEDGLILTNFHCSYGQLNDIQKPGEDLLKTGFIAKTLEEERKSPGLFVDQLISINDITKEVVDAFNSGKTTDEKNQLKTQKIKDLQTISEDKSLVKRVVSLYNGGKYSLYTYKRYKDIRLVLIPEYELGLYGGDPDNYTFPRYSLDFTIWRAYDENGKPLKVIDYFKWSTDGAKEDEPIFVIGNPGQTNKLRTMAQLNYMRDYTYDNSALAYQELTNIFRELIDEHIGDFNDHFTKFYGASNGAKRYIGVLKGLRNEYYMARKKDFENTFKSKIKSNPDLNAKYGSMWDNIESTRQEMRKIAGERYAYARSTDPRTEPYISKYLKIAYDLVEYAQQMQLPEDQRKDTYKGKSLDSTIAAINPSKFDVPLETRKLRITEILLKKYLGENNELAAKMFGDKNGNEAAELLMSKSEIKTKEQVDNLIKKGSEAILNSNDPLIYFILKTNSRFNEIVKLEKEINETESAYTDMLGQALYAVYGTSIPPDGSGTLRIGDGVLKSYHYNGTIAPTHTTFYGMYDRYYSFNKKTPWALPEKWANPSKEFNLSTPFTMISTHDIVGGSSGSPVINEKRELVGLAFDGNIESNSGYFIYDTEENRMISVCSQAILEAISHIYNSERITEELKNGKMN